MTANRVRFCPGDAVEWVGEEEYVEGDSARELRTVRPGDQGVYVAEDGPPPAEVVVVSFPTVGGFCTSISNLRQVREQ